jgi:hypothetical protein
LLISVLVAFFILIIISILVLLCACRSCMRKKKLNERKQQQHKEKEQHLNQQHGHNREKSMLASNSEEKQYLEAAHELEPEHSSLRCHENHNRLHYTHRHEHNRHKLNSNISSNEEEESISSSSVNDISYEKMSKLSESNYKEPTSKSLLLVGVGAQPANSHSSRNSQSSQSSNASSRSGAATTATFSMSGSSYKAATFNSGLGVFGEMDDEAENGTRSSGRSSEKLRKMITIDMLTPLMESQLHQQHSSSLTAAPLSSNRHSNQRDLLTTAHHHQPTNSPALTLSCFSNNNSNNANNSQISSGSSSVCTSSALSTAFLLGHSSTSQTKASSSTERQSPSFPINQSCSNAFNSNGFYQKNNKSMLADLQINLIENADSENSDDFLLNTSSNLEYLKAQSLFKTTPLNYYPSLNLNPG